MSTQISILIVHQSKRDINQVPCEQLLAIVSQAMILTKAAYTHSSKIYVILP
ncbi:hypothetical protein SAMN02982990_00759 [Photorhabdus luminescens]|uniref:Uncharacterized protein n=1 Tax=Photorhabdus luminescens TaxID=29488 RepID=A0A1G5Q2A8_PHOLU|nr:hypothetical protein SAMN02982990_00759 [Photorhabdus luminescens]